MKFFHLKSNVIILFIFSGLIGGLFAILVFFISREISKKNLTKIDQLNEVLSDIDLVLAELDESIYFSDLDITYFENNSDEKSNVLNEKDDINPEELNEEKIENQNPITDETISEVKDPETQVNTEKKEEEKEDNVQEENNQVIIQSNEIDSTISQLESELAGLNAELDFEDFGNIPY